MRHRCVMSESCSRHPDFGQFGPIWDASWLMWVEDLEAKGGRLKQFTLLKTWGPRSSSIIDRDRGKANVEGSRDGETRGMLATIIAFLTHWPLTNVCHRHIASTAGSNHGVSETGEQTQLLLPKEIERRSVQLRAAVCGRLTQQAQIPANVVSCWRAPTFWVPAINQGKTKQGAECAHTALIARYALATDL